jgi:hypothetical protein
MEEYKMESEEADKAIDAEVVSGNDNKSVSLWEGDGINRFMQSLGVRECNTLPEKVRLIVTFREDRIVPKKYSFKGTEGQSGDRPCFVINAIIKYNPDASHLILGGEYPLALPKNAIIGLANYLNAFSKDKKLKGRTFAVLNVNRQTYKWEEITEQVDLTE